MKVAILNVIGWLKVKAISAQTNLQSRLCRSQNRRLQKGLPA
jgi:hypothetical protein